MNDKLGKLLNTLRFLLPELQLVELVREKGVIARKEEADQSWSPPLKAQQYSSRPDDQGHSQRQGTMPSSTAPMSAGSYSQDQNQSLTSKQLDQIFLATERNLYDSIVGQQAFIKDLIAAYKQGYVNGGRGKARNVILLAGAAGTGKRTTLDKLVSSLYHNKLTSSMAASEIELNRYESDEIAGNFIEDMAKAFAETEGTVLFTDIKGADASIIQLIAQLASEGQFRTKEGTRISAEDYFLIFYIDEMANREEYGRIPASLMDHLPAVLLKSVSATAISSPLDMASMKQVVTSLLAQGVAELSQEMQLKISVNSEVPGALAGLATANKSFGEAIEQWIEKELSPVVSSLWARNEIRRGDNIIIGFENEGFYVENRALRVPIQELTFVSQESLEDILGELNALIGLESVKKFVQELVKTVQVNKLRATEGERAVAMALHMVFTGNPGTGKTTVARLVGRILKGLGLLKQGQLVEVARQDLVGQYVGSTAPKTMAKITEALGGVLFIDEAYTLARHDHDTFGREAIDTIVKAMEDHRDNLVVVIAGYTAEIEDFLRSNPGLRSRFPFIVEFPDYTPANMLEIMQLITKNNGFRIEESALGGLEELFEQRQIPGRNDSGNGRLVRNLFEEAVRKQSTRIGGQLENGQPDLQLLTTADFGIGEKEAFNIENELAAVVGLDKVKAFVRTLEKQLIVDRRRKEAGVQVDSGQMLNMIFSGNPGTGKTTMARLVANMLRSMGYLKKGHLIEVDRSDLVGEYVGSTAKKTKQVVESALGGVLFIDEAYALAQDGVRGGGYGKESIDTLVRLVELHKDNLVVILAGYTDDMQQFLKVNPGLSSRFPLQIEFPDYSADEMQRIATLMVKTRGFKFGQDVSQLLRGYFDEKQIPGRKDGGNGRLVRNTLEEAIRRQAERLADYPVDDNDKLNELTAADFNLLPQSERLNGQHSALAMLDQIVGLNNVKEFVRSLSAQIEVSRKREALGLPKASAQTLHMVFKGNPGTGKTTIARILAQRFKELGVIKSDTLVETDRSGLVAGYLGQTALKTREVIESALGGVLFVDEAYALAEGDHYGQEAIDTLVKAMDDYRDRLIVVLAGYENDMERFLTRNAGLRSRFPNLITFPDYSVEEMLEIARRQVRAQGYVLTREAERKLEAIFVSYIGDITAGNGRLVRNLIEKAIRSHALRISQNPNATAEELSTLTPEDF
ncbi:AAA family ATPase [Paenibacillus sp. NPDC058071]|uniref:AAA family ATPase n=1 Tax=Paenibacillus sp. NPDC058071 TaxID=3346326 RepID=UPI0036DB5176